MSANSDTIKKTVLGRHLIAEVWTDERELLNDVDRIMQIIISSANAAEMTILDTGSHHFTPQGVTAYALLAESHISIHTWPEYGYAAVDIYTCGKEPRKALEELKKQLKAKKIEVVVMDRGEVPSGN